MGRKIKTFKEQEQEIQILEEQKVKNEKTLEELKAKVFTLEEQIKGFESDISDTNLQIKLLKGSKRKAKAQIRALQAFNQDLNKKLTQKKRKLQKEKEKVLEILRKKEDYSTKKYGPEYMQDLGELVLTNGENHE